MSETYRCGSVCTRAPLEFLGEIERFVATTLYPWRLPITGAAVAMAFALAVVARRRRWDRPIRRHPRARRMSISPRSAAW